MPSELKPRYQPRAQLCTVLAWLWIFPSLGAIWILLTSGSEWRHAGGWRDGLRAVRFEQWTALSLLALHGFFMVMARWLRRTEPFREAPKDDEDDLNETS